jgi:DNA modification methylase
MGRAGDGAVSVRIITGDALDQLRLLPDESVHCCVTSPPYFGLRDYGIVGQIGLEPSPDEYVAAIVAVFREVRRVLRSDGTLWLNLGDSYAGSWGNQGRKQDRGTQRPINGPMLQQFNSYPERQPFRAGNPDKNRGNSNRDGLGPVSGCKPKDLIGIPWLVAFALRVDGWWLRSDIIWAKTSPMPESVTDRPTNAHEHIFLLSKSRRYYYDADAVKEPDVAGHKSGNGYARVDTKNVGFRLSYGERGSTEQWEPGNGRNMRNVWHLGPEPYADAHFATFITEIPRRAIIAGSPEGGTVLDCFGGAGTTGLVADRMGRNAVLIELNPEYSEMARRRIHGDAPLFADVKRDKPGSNQAIAT